MLQNKFLVGYRWFNEKLGLLHHLVSLAGRLYVANVFFSAGILKIRDWDTTLFLFEEEYQVPLLSPLIAAYLGTLGELLFPVLLVLGATTRFAALGLFIVNVVAVLSLAEIAPAALYLHGIWALILAQIAVYGGGVISVDAFLKLECPETELQRSSRYAS